jgi:hypothetical protein
MILNNMKSYAQSFFPGSFLAIAGGNGLLFHAGNRIAA